jgi:ligand-binding sensor domain-containing protein/signal transduction histidine kinase
MRKDKYKKRLGVLLLAWLSVVLASALMTTQGEQLPIKTYTTADGLVRDQVNRIVRDSHGFLWFCTVDGLSRFDGYKFTNYTTDQGLPSRVVNDVLETRSGVYWVATNGGLCRFNPTAAPQGHSRSDDERGRAAHISTSAPGPKFIVCDQKEAAHAVTVLLEDHRGTLWGGANGGLYKQEQKSGRSEFHFVDLGMPAESGDGTMVQAILEDRSGALWVGTRNSGLYRHWPDGRTERYTSRQGLPSNWISSLSEDREGQLWVGTRNGLCRLVRQPEADRPIVAHVYTTRDGLPAGEIRSLLLSADGRMWVGMYGGLSEFVPRAKDDHPEFRSYTMAQGLSGFGIWALAEDGDHNLWIGTDNGGAMKMGRSGFTTYTEVDGLGSSRINSIFGDQAGNLCAISTGIRKGREWIINSFNGKNFIGIRPNVPRNINDFGWGWNQITLQDHTGEWWVPTGHGLYRFPRASHVEQLAHTRPKAVYNTKNGLANDTIFRLYEDLRGDVWISTISNVGSVLTRWQRATETFHNYSGADGPQLSSILATAFREDGSGHLWIGTTGTGLLRYAKDGFKLFTSANGLPPGWIPALHADHAGRLWVATTQGGLGRIDETTADPPRIITYTTAEGLSSNDVRCITEDRWGRIYIGTGRGLDRLDPATGHIKHFTSTDGLARGKVEDCFCDRQGALWFGTALGLSRLVPEPDLPQSPPPILINGLRIAGSKYPISELGETEVSRLDLAPNQNQLQIEFVGLEFGLGELLRYQYKLEGADHDWSGPTDQRSVNYANLATGRYRFLVRAVTAEGVISSKPASITFRVFPPLWRRWWFVTLSAALTGLLIYAAHRYRVARLIELEQVRTRIATDLHDDIGSSLSRMAILSEVAKRRMEGETNEAVSILTDIADSARGAVDSMSDIVWAIDPRRDDLSNVVFRVRQFASDLLGAQGITWSFQAPAEFDKITLNPQQRRHLFLIFKEAINNSACHADCKSVSLSLAIAHNQIIGEIRDDGRGFAVPSLDRPPGDARDGHGLENIRTRSIQLGGRLSVDSSPGRGTCIKVVVPLKRAMA